MASATAFATLGLSVAPSSIVFLNEAYTSDDSFAFITLSSNTILPKYSDTVFILILLFCFDFLINKEKAPLMSKHERRLCLHNIKM